MGKKIDYEFILNEIVSVLELFSKSYSLNYCTEAVDSILQNLQNKEDEKTILLRFLCKQVKESIKKDKFPNHLNLILCKFAEA